jgi:transglutaminase-like putative cysteine protease
MESWLYRHDEVVCGRPYGCDVDEGGWLWEGCGADRLTGHHLRTAAWRQLSVPWMGGRPAYQVFAWEGKLLCTVGEAPFFVVHDPVRQTCLQREVPASRPIVWYGTKAAGNKVLLFERSESMVLVLDRPDAQPRVVACPFPGQLASGWAQSDGLVYCPLEDPARLARFDPATERFVDVYSAPSPEATLNGRHEHRGVLYTWDSARGRILPVELGTGRWLDPIATPDHGSVYGFLGGGFSFRGRAYLCLSTYAHPSRLDPKTGKIVVPEGPLTVDGRPPRFLERFLVFDPETRRFEYLAAPAQPDGVPMLCYHWTDGERFAITGIVIPFDAPDEPGHQVGPWLVLQSEPAGDEPGFALPDLSFDRQAHLARHRRGYGRGRSLFLPELPHTPPIRNLRGPATHYPPGRESELARRASRTDRSGYLAHLAKAITRGVPTQAEKVARVAGYVHRALYYNPIQVPQAGDPVAVLESHDARCGSGVAVTLALLEALGVPARCVALNHHTVAEATYDGGEHLVDALFFGAKQPQRDGRVLSVEELRADPYFADGFAQECFAYDPDLLQSEDGYWVLGYVFGVWGSEPYYSYYLGAEKDHPPTLPMPLPAQRLGEDQVRLNWGRSLKMAGGEVEYEVRVCADRAGQEEVFRAAARQTFADWRVPERNWMYFVEVRAMDQHRRSNSATWYPAARSNFVLVPEDQYGWYGVL